MPQSYIVGVREVHVRHYKVEAQDQDEARSLVDTRGSEVIDLEFSEYSHELGRDTWSVDEEKEADCTEDSHAGFHSPERQPSHYSSLEVFQLRDKEMAADVEGELVWLSPGWYWQFAEPGEAPESNIYGPFPTSRDAYEAATGDSVGTSPHELKEREHGIPCDLVD